MILNGEAGEQKQTKAAKSKNAYGQLVVFPFVWYVSPKIRSVIFPLWRDDFSLQGVNDVPHDSFHMSANCFVLFFFFFVNRIKITNMR